MAAEDNRASSHVPPPASDYAPPLLTSGGSSEQPSRRWDAGLPKPTCHAGYDLTVEGAAVRPRHGGV